MKRLVLPILLLALQAAAQTPRLSDEAVIFRTDYGDIAVAFYPDEAPLHTKQILRLVRGGIYTHKLFFRTDKNYVTQVENYNARIPPLSADELKLIEKIPAEFNSIPHRRGILSMARFDDPNSAESSFSFVLGTASNLDRQYTVFGEVIQNINVLDEIEKLPPKSVYINSAEVVAREDLPKLKLASAGPSPLANPTVQFIAFTVLALVGFVIYEKLNKK